MPLAHIHMIQLSNHQLASMSLEEIQLAHLPLVFIRLERNHVTLVLTHQMVPLSLEQVPVTYMYS